VTVSGWSDDIDRFPDWGGVFNVEMLLSRLEPCLWKQCTVTAIK